MRKEAQGAAVGVNIESNANSNSNVSGHRASVEVTEIEGKIAENARRYAFFEAFPAAEKTNLHSEPMDIKEAQRRPDWLKWETAIREELNSLKQHGTYKRVKELPPCIVAV